MYVLRRKEVVALSILNAFITNRGYIPHTEDEIIDCFKAADIFLDYSQKECLHQRGDIIMPKPQIIESI